MKTKAILQGVSLVLLLAVPAAAQLGAGGAKPAATLLLPYFEVDLSSRTGVTTMFDVGNASAAPALAKVTVWTDWSVPTLSFYIYLTGYDVETLNVRDLFSGILPQTADDPRDPSDTISPVGPFSMDGWFVGCGANLMSPRLSVGQISRLRRAHIGKSVGTVDDCVGESFGDKIARGYITVDNVNRCEALLPTDPGYFVNLGAGVASNVNQLWGDYFFVEPRNHLAQGDNLVHIEAADGLTDGNIPLLDPDTGATVANILNRSDYTFYGRYVGGGADNREPLSTSWAVRYLLGGLLDSSQVIVWRDSTSADVSPPGGLGWCGGAGPSWRPLAETEVIAFDLQEQAVEICNGSGAPHCFGLEAGRYQVGAGDLDPPFSFGWLHLNLNAGADAPLADADFGTTGTLSQSYVSVIHTALGRFSMGMAAVPLRSAFEDTDDGIGPVP